MNMNMNMNEVMPEQGRIGLIGTTEQQVDSMRWLAPDNDSKTHVYLLVFTSDDAPPSDWHWSISWKVGGARGQTKAWRHVHVQVQTVPVRGGPHAVEKRYVFWGAMTKAEGVLTARARKISLGKMGLRARMDIERLALGVPVMRYGTPVWGSSGARAMWCCQDWVRELGARMVAAGIVGRKDLESALVAAYKQ